MTNRIIKFRAWDKQDKVFVADNVVGNILYEIHANKHHDLNDGFILQQFTGLIDKTGQDIYEGDILQLVDDAGNEIKVTCEFGLHKRKMDSGYEVKIAGFAFISPLGMPTFPIIHNYAGKSDLDIMEVIGNIYENPELIKDIL